MKKLILGISIMAIGAVGTIYEKAKEQHAKFGVDIEDMEVKNRFEIRLKNERAYRAVVDLLTYYDAERTAFSIINHYLRFVDVEEDKPKSAWKLNEEWAWFIGEHRGAIKLTTQPEPFTLDCNKDLYKKRGAMT